MSAAPKYTEREMVLAKREGYVFGRTVWPSLRPQEAAQMEAAERYPLPKVTRPRVVEDEHDGRYYMAKSDRVYYAYERTARSAWTRITHLEPTTARIRIWSDLLANPTEEVEDA